MDGSEERMSRAELIARIHSLEARVREGADCQALVHELQVHQQELRAQQDQLLEAQLALEAARDRYADLFDLAPIGYVMLDPHGLIQEINEAGLRLLGASEQQRVRGLPLARYVPQVDRETLRAHLQLLRKGAEHAETELHLCPPGTNDVVIVRLYSRRWGRTESQHTECPTAMVDVTARRRAEEERRAADRARRALVEEERAMRAANEAKDRFLAALSHELRTPLTPIALALDVLERRNALPAALEPTIRMIRRNVEQEARLIDDLLDVTRIVHDKLRCDRIVVDLHVVLREVVAVFEGEAAAARISLTLETAAPEHYVLGDPFRLKQVASNLLRNALRHTGRDGEIVVRSETPSPGTIRWTVRDNGVGIDPVLLDRIFLAFEQVERDRGMGLGLGLAISKGLVEQHGGRITATSGGLGTGVTFSVELPTLPAPAEAPEPPAASPRRAHREQVVLVVEDHADSAEALAVGLAAAGYRVLLADSVESALAQAAEPFDILVSDIRLPDGSGLELMRALLQQRPVIGISLSGYGGSNDVQASRAAGFQRHLVKPVDLDVLSRTITDLLEALPADIRR